MKKHEFNPVTQQVNFPELEEKLLKEWYENGIVQKYLERNSKSKKIFSFIDGPITANNPMGVHHAWGRTFKDLWQRYHNLKGEAGRFQNGFDCQGLWVEVEVEKELGIKNKKDIENLLPGDKKGSIAKFVELCKNRVYKFSKIQTEQTVRLGNFMNWDNSYFTMSDENNYMIWHFLKTCHQKNWIYKGRDSVPWCPRCETAISQHEMLTEDYKEVVHDSIYFELPIIGRNNEFLLVWTTTPWTIPANIAVAVDEKLDYSLVKGNTGYLFWVVKELVNKIFGENHQVIKTVKGKELVGLSYRGPFDDLPAVKEVAHANPDSFHKVIPTDPQILPITTVEGTGLVHTAVSAGAEDYRLGIKLGLPMIPVIADNANYLDGLGFLTGKNAKKHPELILDYLTQEDNKGNNCVFLIEKYKHRYPACWRCKTELVWKVADEWYIAMDKPDQKDSKQRTLRQQMQGVAKKINWLPNFGLERELDWLSNMHDWLISKPNRYWGLALPIYECKKCRHFEVIGSKVELKQKAISGWEEFSGHSPHKPWIDDVKIKCEKCGAEVERLPDVGNVWLDAGIVPYSTLVDPKTGNVSYTDDKIYWQKWFPADFITESFPGQFKNWFYSMIAMSTVLERIPPFKTVLGYGTLLGEDGRPMHKSWGNSIEFNVGADKIGADVMRWMFSSHDPVQNMLFGYKKADETRRRFHLLLWNVYNFFITYALLDNWQPGESDNPLHVLDDWILSRLWTTSEKVSTSLDSYDIFSATQVLEKLVNDLSLWYVRRSRDRIGPGAQSELDKKICYQTLYQVLVTICKLLAPFIPFMSDEMYQNLTGLESVHLSNWPQVNKLKINIHLETEMEQGIKLASVLHAFRKKNCVKVRIPLRLLNYSGPHELIPAVKKVVLDEVNVYQLEYTGKQADYEVSGEVTIANQDIQVGNMRELIRKIQIFRKEKGLRIDQKIRVQLPEEFDKLPAKLLDYVMRKTLVESYTWGEDLTLLIGS